MFVYFIQGQTTGLIKIGQTARSVSNRLRVIQSNSPDKLEVIKVIKSEKGAEQFLHDKFESVRSHGEWFYPSADLIEFIQSSDKIEIPALSIETEKPVSIGNKLNQLLDKKQMTHYRLAILTGIGHDSMSLYRNGKRTPKAETIKKIAETLGVTIDELMK